jgi:hypothetical protein
MTDDALAGRLSFGVNLGRLTTTSDPGPVAAARRAEADGFDVVSVADHVGSSAPFVLLGAAAAVTTRVRLRTYVLDYGFWNPGLLARDVATLDLLSGGRVEVGLGAGHMRHEHEAVGLPFPPYQERLAELDTFATRLRAALDDPGMVPRPVQSQVPLFLAAMSASGLALAARHGQFVALSGALQIPGRTPGTFILASTAPPPGSPPSASTSCSSWWWWTATPSRRRPSSRRRRVRTPPLPSCSTRRSSCSPRRRRRAQSSCCDVPGGGGSPRGARTHRPDPLWRR